jgi:predicted DNA-binding transcriptional regulator AlpA
MSVQTSTDSRKLPPDGETPCTNSGRQHPHHVEVSTQKRPQRAKAPKAKREPRYISVVAICEELEITRSTFYDWRAKGKGPKAFPLPNGDLRITKASYEAWLKSLEEEGK